MTPSKLEVTYDSAGFEEMKNKLEDLKHAAEKFDTVLLRGCKWGR